MPAVTARSGAQEGQARPRTSQSGRRSGSSSPLLRSPQHTHNPPATTAPTTPPTAPGTKTPMPDTHAAAAVPSCGGLCRLWCLAEAGLAPVLPHPSRAEQPRPRPLPLHTSRSGPPSPTPHQSGGRGGGRGAMTSNGRLALASASQRHACFRAGQQRTSVERLPKRPGTLGPRAPCVPPGTGLHSQASHSPGLMGSQKTVPLDGSIAPEMPTGPSPRAAPSARRQKKKGQASHVHPASNMAAPMSQALGGGGEHSMEPRPLWLPSACFRDQNARARLSEAQRGSPRLPAVAMNPSGTPSFPLRSSAAHLRGHTLVRFGPGPRAPTTASQSVPGPQSGLPDRGQPDPEAHSGRTQRSAAAHGQRPRGRQ